MSVRKELSKQNKKKDEEKIKNLIKIIGVQWPDLTIDEEMLRSPTSTTVKVFYSKFYSEFETLKNNLETNLLKQEVYTDQNAGYDDVSLTVRLNEICMALGTPFYLTDMCEPQPKRTILFFSILMNLIIYLKSNTDYMDEITECVEKNENYQNMKTEKDSLLSDIQHTNELILKLEHNINTLNADIENIDKEYKEILVQKTERDFKYQQDYSALNKLKDDLKIADECLDNLRKESTSLQEQIVSEDEIEKLKQEIEVLKNKFENLETDRINIILNLEERKKKIEYYKRCLASLDNVIFSSEYFDKLKSLREQLSTHQHEEDKIQKQIVLKTNELKNSQEENSKLCELFEKLLKEQENLSKNTTTEINALNNECKHLEMKTEEEKVFVIALVSEIAEFQKIRSTLIKDIDEFESTFSKRYEQWMKSKEEIFQRFNDVVSKFCK